ncbi:hypothetical protein EVAR_38428_1 [Eumeta japonica]|uniref:KIND domain-containing protein n=1 Tax=Eumeta variegata TaxID=151549 RepID=A0A4C1WWV6_EUMVA|nr:hypothetical protein EVAR_38428_1 [Eumeta japonica]
MFVLNTVLLSQLVVNLALVIYHALDYTHAEDEERLISPDLERLITEMTASEVGDAKTISMILFSNIIEYVLLGVLLVCSNSRDANRRVIYKHEVASKAYRTVKLADGTKAAGAAAAVTARPGNHSDAKRGLRNDTGFLLCSRFLRRIKTDARCWCDMPTLVPVTAVWPSSLAHRRYGARS